MRGILVLTLPLMGLTAACIGTDIIDGPPPELEPARISLEANTLALQVGDERQLTAKYIDASGQEVPSAQLQWQSRQPQVVEVVEASGTFRALSAGQAELVVSLQEPEPLEAQLLVTVVETATAAATIEIVALSSDTLVVGEQVQLEAQVKSFDGTILTPSIVWQSSDQALAMVGNNGQLSALAAGEVSIVASAEGLRSPPLSLRIRAPGAGPSGMFSGRGSYNVEGTVTINLDSSPPELRFGDNFSASNGPDLQVYLSPQQQVVPSSVALGRLKSLSGAQTYAIPEGTDLSQLDWVLIHCVPFNVTFGLASLE